MKPIVGDKVWFGPKSFGWGLVPVSWEGWVASLVAIGALLGGHALFADARAFIVDAFVLTLFVPLAFLKGTSPGGRSEYLHYRRKLVEGWRPPEEPSVTRIMDGWKE